MSEERLQRILSRAGIASRRKAEELIREGRVTVNGRIAGIGDKANLQTDAIAINLRGFDTTDFGKWPGTHTRLSGGLIEIEGQTVRLWGVKE